MGFGVRPLSPLRSSASSLSRRRAHRRPLDLRRISGATLYTVLIICMNYRVTNEFSQWVVPTTVSWVGSILLYVAYVVFLDVSDTTEAGGSTGVFTRASRSSSFWLAVISMSFIAIIMDKALDELRKMFGFYSDVDQAVEIEKMAAHGHGPLAKAAAEDDLERGSATASSGQQKFSAAAAIAKAFSGITHVADGRDRRTSFAYDAPSTSTGVGGGNAEEANSMRRRSASRAMRESASSGTGSSASPRTSTGLAAPLLSSTAEEREDDASWTRINYT